MKKIYLTRTNAKKLREKYSLSHQTLSKILGFQIHSYKAGRIRTLAMRYYDGKLLTTIQ